MDISKHVVQPIKQAFISALRNEEDTSHFVQRLIDTECQISEKYQIISMESLIELNSQNVDQLRRIIIALSILEKYTRHLLKPEEQRSNMWKYVKFSNQIFKDRVDAIQGGRDLMKAMGYTKDIKDGLAFPPDEQTDPEQLTDMLADIILGKQEITLYLTGSHPHSQYIDKLLPQNTIKELREFQTELGNINPNSIKENMGNQQPLRQVSHRPDPQPRSSPVQQSPSPSPSYRQSSETSHYAQVSGQVPNTANEAISYTIPSESQSSHPIQQPATVLQQIPVNVQQIHHNAQPSLGHIDSNQIPTLAKLVAQGKSISSISIEDPERSSSTSTSASTARQVTISSGESQSVAVPANVQVQSNQTPQFNSASDSMVQSSTEESVFPSGSACDICGNRQAEIICEICGNKQLCQGCDNKWHQHPRRQNHKRQNMGGVGDEQPVSDQRSRSLSQGEKTLPPVISSSQNYGLNTQQGAGDDVYVTANFNQPQPMNVGKQTGIGYISHHLQNMGLEGYGRARTSSSGETGLSEMSPGIDPQSVQTGNWSSPQPIPYSYSHQTNVVRPVQTYGSPVSHLPMSSSSPSLATGSPHYFGNHQIQFPNQHYMGNQQLPRNQHLQGNQMLHVGHQMPVQQQSTAPGGPPTSRLLPSIVAIPDLQRRKSKLDINLMTLREEIEEVEAKINELISQNAQFFSDPEYASLYKRKGMLTREKMELEKYEQDLDQVIREEEQNSLTTRKGSLPDVLTQPVIYPPPYVSGTPGHLTSQPQLVNPSAGYVVYQYIPPTMTPGGSLSPETQVGYSLIPAAPQVITQYPQGYRNQNMTPDFQGMYQSPPRSHVRPQQQPVLQGRPDNQIQQQYTPHRRSVDDKIENTAPIPVVKPQHKTHDAMQIEERQNQQNVLKQSPPIPHRPSQAGKPHSYVNLPNLPTSYGDQTPPGPVKPAGGKSWICSHCTLHNSKEGPPYVCEVCSKTSTNPQYVDELESKMMDPKLEYVDDTEDETVVLEVGKHIGEVADQIYLEKIAAQKQYKEKLEKEKHQQAAIKPALPKPKLPDPIVTKTVISKPETSQVVESAHKLINRPQESVSSSTDTPPYSGGKISGSLQGKNFAETMEDIQRRKQQEEMAYEGKKLLMLLKNCEKDGVDADEVEIAVELSGELPVDKWLKEKWMPKVDRVIHMATNQGAQMEQNDVGELSVAESKDALKINDCDVTRAAKFCVENRRKLYKEIQKYGNFAREEVLQAMLHSQGELESAVDEMNSKWLQLFYDRIWPTDDNIQQPVEEDPFLEEQQRAQENAIARATSEICNSVKNSVLSHKTFQSVIKDRNNDLERRIRLILVEGKLQSWGRAEIVIRILDEEVAQNKLDASLEEVVEAVRNCGDRSSSLVFLKQYCECCYAQFPMSKIRNLGCPCKICVQCVRQNFEVAIREKHVRNMNCPLCCQPNMEDMDAASDYLTFLSMLLQTMVSQEIMELYHFKLRDWHLQKDQNFRWCVHCGNGFIWTMGDQILRMVCPTCQRGTCFNCKKMWEDQHEGLTCEQFTQWKMDNDPENQTAGLARYLEDNGIDCPSCKMKYSLAKGGCMHFKCPQCGFEFCSGCSQPFYQKGVCRKYNSCRNKGLHCHHPRNCLYYLRDEEFEDLQTLLKNHKIQFNTKAPDQESGQTCPVMEQKEDPEGKRDEACGREVQEGFAGLCGIHFKEYLVSLINKRNLDPLAIMSVEAMKRLVEREEKKIPERKANEGDAKYRKRLEQVIREIEPLTRQQ